MTNNQKVPISERALLQRINRKLHSERETLRKTRGGDANRDWRDLGDYYIVDWDRGFLQETHLDLEAKGRELEVLQPWEALHVPEGT